MKKIYILIIAIIAGQAISSAETKITDLRTLGLESPLGIGSNPTFSWKTESDKRGFRQGSYRITVTDSTGSAVWDSGVVESRRQTDVPYTGEDLQSRMKYYWTVTVSEAEGGSHAVGESSFETGILSGTEWENAVWIAADPRSSYNSKMEIYPSEGNVSSRYITLDVTSTGLRAAGDPGYSFVQLAEIEIYDSNGVNIAPEAVFTATDSWELPGYGWSLRYINDGIISGATNGYTTPQNVTKTTITADLGDVRELSHIVLYPRQDSPAATDGNKAANFPSSFTVATGTGQPGHTVIFEADRYPAPTFEVDNNVPYFGRNFTVDRGKTVAGARLYASALGVFTMRLNGLRVTSNVLEPGESAYDKHILYSTYDVTPLIVPGVNTLLAQVAGGMADMSMMSDRFVKPELSGNTATTSLRAMLHITYTDGTSDLISTDKDWGTYRSPVTGVNWYGGEDYDARLEIPGLFTAGYDVGSWGKCKEVSPVFCAPAVSSAVYDVGEMCAREYEPLRVVETWKAVSVTKNSAGNYLVDFGQNFAGTYSFTLKGEAGTTITLYDSELQENGACKFEYMYQPAGASNKTLDRYTFRGDPAGETWGPEFMYHGFRYLEIAGLDEAPSPDSFVAKRIRSDIRTVGSFHTSDPLLNDIHRLCFNGIQSQLYNTVTDCPHREKLGWLDVPNMMYQSLTYNFDVKSLLSKIVMDAFDSQGDNGYVPSTVPHFMRAYDDDLNWGGAAITIPWRNYRQYGDMTLMTRYYDRMKRLIDYYGSLTRGNIIRDDYSVLSDWGQETSGLANHTGSSFTLTCTYYYLLGAMAEMAAALSHEEDAAAFSNRAAEVKDAFNRRFFKNGVYEHGNQANYGMALYYGLVEEENIPAVAEALAESVRKSDYSIKTGEIGLRPTLMSLAAHGYNDVVYRMAGKTDYPSYGYWLKQGATTSLEYWDMSLSQNHCMMDHIEEWFYSQLGGISNTGEAYETVRISPWIPSDMASADVSVETPRGKVRMAWFRTKESTRYDVTVPAGSEAKVLLPVVGSLKLYEKGVELGDIPGVSDVEYTDSVVSFTLGGGSYSFAMDGSSLTEESPSEGDDAGVEDPESRSGEVSYYSLLGLPLSAASIHGIVLRKEGNKIRKIFIP